MEDRCIFVPNLAGSSSWWASVYDGHGGEQKSASLRPPLVVRLTYRPHFLGSEASDFLFGSLHVVVASLLGSVPASALNESSVRDGLFQAFVDTDAALLNALGENEAGSTCTAVLKFDQLLYCANTGDSRSVLCRGMRNPDGTLAITAQALSSDHKPNRSDEKERIRQRGGVVLNGRLMGELAVSRAFGDRTHKKSIRDIMRENGAEPPDDDDPDDPTKLPLLIAEPEISCVDLGELSRSDALFVLLACDGLWDVRATASVASACKHLIRPILF
jgi:serine/threonine protein phosphatase PrpC